MSNLLEVRDLSVRAGGKEILHGVNLSIREGDVGVLMGPNAAGKSALLKTIMGDPRYEIVRGSILFNGVKINDLKPYERVKLGIALAFQNPPRIGIKLGYFIDKLSEEFGSNADSVIDELGIRQLVGRELFHGFSGGEMKKTELFITLLQRPRLALLDEPDSGVDIDSLSVIASMINRLIDAGSSVLLVTHTGHILRYLRRLDVIHVMINGKIVYSGDPSIMEKILRYGYEKFEKYGVVESGRAIK
ncbi:MAG: ABC transporter ATP-binding protein [Candidatus Baldrarchaeia archaeon]